MPPGRRAFLGSIERFGRRAVLGLAAFPEVNVLGFGFLLHLPWELWLSGSGSGVDGHLRSSGELPLALSLAALAHAGINLLAFWFIAGLARSRRWPGSAGADAIGIFVLSSLVFTLVAESLVMGVLTQWEHPAALPTFAAPGLGLPSLLQGIVAPLLIAGILRRQLRADPEEES